MVALAILLAAGIGYLGYRVISLEHQLDRISAQLGAPAQGKPSANDGKPSAEPAAAQGHEQRIAKLERELHSLQADVRSLEQATETSLNEPTSPPDPKQILSVVSNEASRIRDRQLDFQRNTWTKWRRNTLKNFAIQQKLTDEQNADMDELLVSEVDRLIGLFRRDDLIDKPEQFAQEAANVLRDTDYAAHGVLTNEQFAPWAQLRAYERHTLWPWLPE
jgi:hypothetical protein